MQCIHVLLYTYTVYLALAIKTFHVKCTRLPNSIYEFQKICIHQIINLNSPDLGLI
jgi:hypothetical protein